MSNDLQHHGIKGMRWGIRRFQNEDGSLTAEGRKRYGEDRYKDYGDGRIEIEKGAQLQRVLSDNTYARQDLNGMRYASFKKMDNNQYIQMLGKAGQSRVLKLTAQTTLKSPSSTEAARLFFKMLKDDPSAMKEYKDAIHIADEKQFMKEVDEIAKGNLMKKNANGENLYERYFLVNHAFVYDEYLPTAKQKYFDILKANGYNMIRDDYDWYTSNGSSSSVILLDASSSTKVISDQVLTKAMLKKADKYCYMYATKGEEYARKFGIS